MILIQMMMITIAYLVEMFHATNNKHAMTDILATRSRNKYFTFQLNNRRSTMEKTFFCNISLALLVTDLG